MSLISSSGHGHVAKIRGRGVLLSQNKIISGNADRSQTIIRSSYYSLLLNERMGMYGGDGGGGLDTNGFVFITNVAPVTGTVTNKVYDTDNVVLESFATDDNQIIVYVVCSTGKSHYKPIVEINGNEVTSLNQNGMGQWTGSISIDITSVVKLTASHEDGAEHQTDIVKVTAPNISDIMFLGYPGSQSAVKSGDSITVRVTGDSFDRIQIYDYQACQAQTTSVSATTTYDLPVLAATRGSGLIINQTVQLRIRSSATGVWSNVRLGTNYHTSDGVGVLQLDNDVPVISTIAQGNITYPSSQSAIKDSETATVAHTVTGASSVTYTSPNGDLSITNPSTYETSKVVTRIAGSYNIATNNLTITAIKASNATQATRSAVIYIAHTAPTLTVTEPSRLRSGGNNGTAAQNHTITITASQNLYNAPTLVAPVGVWQGAGFSGSTTSWTRALQIHDNDTKGVQSWGAISGTNLAGVQATIITGDANYTIGGFVARVLTVAAWPNRETAIGTQVSDTSKVRATNLVKYVTGTWNEIYENALADHNDINPDLNNYFTITQPTGVLNSSGNLFRINDLPAAVGNTSGLLTFNVEETA